MRSPRLSRWCAVAACIGIAPAGAAAAQPPATALIAKPTQAQLEQAAAALGLAPADLRADATAAYPILSPYLITLMCVQDDRATPSLVGKYVGSRGTSMFSGWGGAFSPGKRMRHHDMAGCISVQRIQNWKRVARNEVSFDIVFVADDSGESYIWKTVVHKEPDGSWLLA